MNRNQKILIVIIIVLILVSVISLSLFFINNKKGNNTIVEEHHEGEEIESGEFTDYDDDNQWFFNLLKIADMNFKSVYKDDSTFKYNENGVYKISFTEFKKLNKDVDLKSFNTPTIACDLDNTYYIITKQSNGSYTINTKLSCKNLEVTNPEIFDQQDVKVDSDVKPKGQVDLHKLIEESKTSK